MSAATQPVVDAIRENRERFEAWCRSLSEEELARPVPESTWIVRDFIAHLTTLDPVMASIFRETAAGEGLAPTDDRRAFDIDAFNEKEVMARRDWTLDQLFDEGARHRAALIELLLALSEDHVERQMYFGGDAKRRAGTIPLKLFLAGWAQHDPIHVADMLRALPERAEDPDTRAWVDNVFVKGYQAAMNRPA